MTVHTVSGVTAAWTVACVATVEPRGQWPERIYPVGKLRVVMLVMGHGELYVEATRAALEKAFDVSITLDIDDFARRLGTAHVGVLLGRQALEAERELMLAGIRCPLVRVTDMPPERTPTGEDRAGRSYVTMSCHRIGIALSRVAIGVAAQQMLATQRSNVLVSSVLGRSSRLRGALFLAFEERPVTSVKSMARLASCSPRTLEIGWVAAVSCGRKDAPTLKQVLILATVLKAVAMWRDQPDATWSKIAGRCRVTPRTLRSYVQKLLGMSPSGLAPERVSGLILETGVRLGSLWGTPACASTASNADRFVVARAPIRIAGIGAPGGGSSAERSTASAGEPGTSGAA